MKYEINITSIKPPMYICPTDEQIRGAKKFPKVPVDKREIVYTRLIETKNIGHILKAVEDSK